MATRSTRWNAAGLTCALVAGLLLVRLGAPDAMAASIALTSPSIDRSTQDARSASLQDLQTAVEACYGARSVGADSALRACLAHVMDAHLRALASADVPPAGSPAPADAVVPDRAKRGLLLSTPPRTARHVTPDGRYTEL